jgi:hypothetical protein
MYTTCKYGATTYYGDAFYPLTAKVATENVSYFDGVKVAPQVNYVVKSSSSTSVTTSVKCPWHFGYYNDEDFNVERSTMDP